MVRHEDNHIKECSLYSEFSKLSLKELEALLLNSKDREEKIFYRTLLNLRLMLDQEKVVGKELL